MTMTPDGSPRQNLELKARLCDPTLVRTALLELRAKEDALLVQADTYFQVPLGRLKLREIRGSEAQLIAYQRSETDAERVSEYRVARVVDPLGMKQVLAASLGLLGTVTKRRQLYLWKECRIHLDQVDDLGAFLEFEVCSRGDAGDDRQRMKTLMTACHVGPEEAICASYADLLGLTAGPGATPNPV